MNTIPSREIKRKGITAVDTDLNDGPVYVLKNDRIAYVVLTPEHYRELVETQHEAEILRVQESLRDLAEGKVRRTSAEALIEQLQLDA